MKQPGPEDQHLSRLLAAHTTRRRLLLEIEQHRRQGLSTLKLETKLALDAVQASRLVASFKADLLRPVLLPRLPRSRPPKG